MSDNLTTVPKWVTIYLWVTVAITLGASIAGYLAPDALFGGWEALSAGGALSLAGPVGLFISRNLGTAIVGIYSLTQKNTSMIKLYLILRVAEDGIDFIHNIIAGNMQVAIMAIVMCAIEIFALTKVKYV
ncbi:MAG: hypothetical protein AAF696_23115 [Bacteroidota bacterium]